MVQFFLRHADGELETRSSGCVESLKAEFNDCHLTVNGCPLEELVNESIIDINADLNGGGKKRKKESR